MVDLAETTGISKILEAAGISFSPKDNFEIMYQRFVQDQSQQQLVREMECRIRNYFETIRIPENATLYDRLLISLRAKDYVATFNWDPLLAQAYKRNRHLGELPYILFLHGNVSIGVCLEHQCKGFLPDRCKVCGEPLIPTQLLYPIGRKNYDQDPFIHQEWTILRDILETAYIFTIIGYAAPESDVEAKGIMLQAWSANRTKELAEIDVVDIKERAEVERTWSPFFVRNHYGISESPIWLFGHARRSCDHFAMATLQQHPCRDNPLPDTDNLAELQAWAKPLVEEEIGLREDGTPFRC